MRHDDLIRAAQPAALIERLAEQGPAPAQEHHGGHASPMESVREATYRGHHIVIRTSYRIEVDEQPIVGHLGVSNDGQVHYHPIPNLGFDSAVDLVKQMIDTFPDDFDPSVHPDEHGSEHEHQHEHGHGDGDRRGS